MPAMHTAFDVRERMLFLRTRGDSGPRLALLLLPPTTLDEDEECRPRRCLLMIDESSRCVRRAGVTRTGGGVMVAGSGSTCAALR